LEDDDVLISYDVVSLFTNIPVADSLKLIRERLERDRYKTLLDVDDVMELLEFILTTTYVCFRGQIDRQKFGTAMGSPVSPLVAKAVHEISRTETSRYCTYGDETQTVEKVCR